MTTTTMPRLANRDDWLAQRKPYWNASATAVLFDEHPFMTAADVAVDKLAGTSQPESRAMSRGNHLEAAVAEWWADELGLAVIEPDVCHVSGVLMATLDRLVVGTTDALEVKTTAKHIDGPERYWWWQCQAQMVCADLDRVHLAVLDAGMDLKSWTVDADADAQAELVERATKFMAFIARGEMPPSVELGYRHLEALHPTPTAEPVALDSDQYNLVNHLHLVRTQLKAGRDHEEDLKRQLAEVLGDAATATYDGAEVLSWRSVTRTSYDTARLRREHPDVAAELAKSSAYRAMRVVGPS